VLKPKYLLFLLFLTSPSAILGQGMSAQLDTPLLMDVSKLDVEWNVGDYAVYDIFADEAQQQKIGTHRIEIKELVGNRCRIDIITTGINGSESIISANYLMNPPLLDLSQAVDIWAKTAMGRFPLGGKSQVRPGETFSKKQDETAKLKGKEIKVTKQEVTYTDGLDKCVIWSHSDLGPYGMFKGHISFGKKYCYYQLTDYQRAN